MKTCTCTKCSTEKPEDDFYPSFIHNGRGCCKECFAKYGRNKKWTAIRSWVQKAWGITQKQFLNLPRDVRLERVAVAREALKDNVVSLVPPLSLIHI